MAKYIRTYYIKNRDRLRGSMARWYERNKAITKRRSAEWKRRNPEKVSASGKRHYAKQDHFANHLRWTYGMTRAEHEAMVAAQKGRCAICACVVSEIKQGVGLQVDHDHDTNEVRGILCHHCNKMLGHAKDNPQILTNAAHYLMRFWRQREKKIA